MRRKLLLASAALSTLAATQACGKKAAPLDPPLPGNPKGSTYDQPQPVDAGPVVPLPGNPKGSHYDTTSEDMKPPVPVTADAGGSKADAGGSKADAGTKPLKK
jgi:hypothetical protein